MINASEFDHLKTKIFILKYFPEISSEMSSTHTFYYILIPNTSYVKKLLYMIFIGVRRESHFLKLNYI